MTTEPPRDRGSLTTALMLGVWVSFFALATAVSAFSLADVRAAPAPDLRFFPPPPPGPDVRAYVTLGYCTFASAVLLFLGMVAATRFVLGKR